MLAKSWSSAIQGVNVYTVEIEVNAMTTGNDPHLTVVGLPDTAVRESRERVWSALCCSGFFPPQGRTTINLAPADVPKEGAGFDLPIALGMIAATSVFDRNTLGTAMSVGELALDGSVRPVRGALPIALHARAQGVRDLLVPEANAAEAAVAEGVNVYGIRHLCDAVEFFRDGSINGGPVRVDMHALRQRRNQCTNDMADIKGQESARRAMEIAAAGGHNMLMVGPPGTGKTMLASRLASILPLMQLEEALETSKVHSIAGALPIGRPLLMERPFRAPHHTISDAGLLGGQSVPRPGEISLAHNGILFLDELPEFRRNVLEVLRQPLESGEVTISRAAGSFTFPASFMLVAAMNPCPCGHYGNLQRQCRCSPGQIQRYRSRVSGPLLDRIDIHVEVAPISEAQLMSRPRGESSETVRGRIETAREIQAQRFTDFEGVRTNAQMPPALMEKNCAISTACRTILRIAINDLNLSARAYDRLLRVSRTIADLAGSEEILPDHITESMQYRTLDRNLW